MLSTLKSIKCPNCLLTILMVNPVLFAVVSYSLSPASITSQPLSCELPRGPERLFLAFVGFVCPAGGFILQTTNAAFVMHHVLTATLRGLLIHFVHNASAHTLLTVVRAGAFALDVPPGMLSFDRFSRRSPAPNSIHAQTLTLPSQFARGSPLLYSRGCWHRH